MNAGLRREAGIPIHTDRIYFAVYRTLKPSSARIGIGSLA